VGGGAWPFLVGGVICLVNSVNERDLNLLNSRGNPGLSSLFSNGGGNHYHIGTLWVSCGSGEDLIVFL
jgi:hypothetical protein